MIPRYTLPEMEKIWSEEERFNIMYKIELYACESLANRNIIPKSAYNDIKSKAVINIERAKEIEKITKHDVAAFVDQLGETAGDSGKYIHFGFTSSDILDTATAVQMKQSSELFLQKLKLLLSALKTVAEKHKYTPTIGRTHGIHAEPTTFGLKILGWYSEIKRHAVTMKNTINTVSYGKMSGAVGNLAHNSADTEEFVCNKLGLKPEPVSTQVIPRDRYATYFSTLAIIASSIERFATEIRHLQRSEVKEVEESFTSGQKGSSAMPHKRNPVLSENLCGLARLVKTYLTGALDNVVLWHERDISHSSFERIALPDASIALDFMLTRFTKLISELTVYPENMKKNLELNRGLVFSECILLELIRKGLTRKEAYKLVQNAAFTSLQSGQHMKSVVMKDKQIRKYLSGKIIENSFSLTKFFSNVDSIFKRTIKK